MGASGAPSPEDQGPVAIPPPRVIRNLHRERERSWPRAHLWLGWESHEFRPVEDAWRKAGARPIEDIKRLSLWTGAVDAKYLVRRDEGGRYWGTISGRHRNLVGGMEYSTDSEAWLSRMTADGTIGAVAFSLRTIPESDSDDPSRGAILQGPEEILGECTSSLGFCLKVWGL